MPADINAEGEPDDDLKDKTTDQLVYILKSFDFKMNRAGGQKNALRMIEQKWVNWSRLALLARAVKASKKGTGDAHDYVIKANRNRGGLFTALLHDIGRFWPKGHTEEDGEGILTCYGVFEADPEEDVRAHPDGLETYQVGLIETLLMFLQAHRNDKKRR